MNIIGITQKKKLIIFLIDNIIYVIKLAVSLSSLDESYMIYVGSRPP